MLITAYFLCSAGVFISHGYFSRAALFFLLAGSGLLLFPENKKIFSFHVTEERLLSLVLPIFIFMFYIELFRFFYSYPVAFSSVRRAALIFHPFLLVFLILLNSFLLAVVFAFLRSQPSQKSVYFMMLCAGYVVMVCVALVVSYAPPIDIHEMFQEAGRKFLRGQNPYVLTYTNPYYGTSLPSALKDPRYFQPRLSVFPYFPGALPLIAFGSLWGDARFLFLLLHLGTALVLFLLGGDSQKAKLWALAHLFNPCMFYVLTFCFLDPVLIFFIALSFLFQHRGKLFLFSVFLGYAASVKQFGLLLFYSLLRTFRIRDILFSFFIFMAILFPFFIWSPSDFLNDTLYHLKQIPREDALSLLSLFMRKTGSAMGVDVFSLMSLGSFLILAFPKKNRQGALISTARGFLFLFLFSYIAFANYYMLALFFIPLSQSINGGGDEESSQIA